MTNSHRLYIFMLLAVLLVSSRTSTAATPETKELDVSLVRAVQSDDVNLTEQLLGAGADPHAIVDPYGDSSAFCAATVSERSRFLALLLEHGANANHWFSKGGNFYSTPLACAVGNGNAVAFETLLAAGADPRASLCGGCLPDDEFSIFEISIFSSAYELAWRLVGLDVVGERDIETLVFDLENHPPIGDEWTDPYRLRLVDWLRENDVAVDPKLGYQQKPERRKR